MAFPAMALVLGVVVKSTSVVKNPDRVSDLVADCFGPLGSDDVGREMSSRVARLAKS